MTTQTNPKWNDNSIQFPRLLAEIMSTVNFSKRQMADLCESMDLTEDDIYELLERADVIWQDAKTKV